MKIFRFAFLAACFAIWACSTAPPSQSVATAAARSDSQLQDALETSDVNVRDSAGSTALHHVADEVVTSRIQARAQQRALLNLIAAGADVNARDGVGQTPLHLATTGDSARMLIDAGADVNARTRSSRSTPLHSAAADWGFRIDVVRALIDAGADVNALDAEGKSPLDFALDRCDTMLAASVNYADELNVVRLIANAGGRLNAPTDFDQILAQAQSDAGGSALGDALLGVAVGVGVTRAAAEGVPAQELLPIVRAVEDIDDRREDEMGVWRSANDSSTSVPCSSGRCGGMAPVLVANIIAAARRTVDTRTSN